MFHDQTGNGALRGADWRDWVCTALMRRATRRHLAALDDGQLSDIGITRQQARREVRRSFPLFGP